MHEQYADGRDIDATAFGFKFNERVCSGIVDQHTVGEAGRGDAVDG